MPPLSDTDSESSSILDTSTPVASPQHPQQQTTLPPYIPALPFSSASHLHQQPSINLQPPTQQSSTMAQPLQGQNNTQRRLGLQSDSLSTLIPPYTIPGDEWVKKVRIIFQIKGIAPLNDANFNPILLPILLARVPSQTAQIAPRDNVQAFLDFVARVDKTPDNIQHQLKLGQGLDRRPSFYYYSTCQHMSDKLNMNDPADHTVQGMAWQLLKSKLPNEMKLSIHTLQIGNFPDQDQLKVLDDTWADLPENLKYNPQTTSKPQQQSTSTVTSDSLVENISKSVMDKLNTKLEKSLNLLFNQQDDYINTIQQNQNRQYRLNRPYYQQQPQQQYYQPPRFQQPSFQRPPGQRFPPPQQPNYVVKQQQPRPPPPIQQQNTRYQSPAYRVGKSLSEDFWYQQHQARFKYPPKFPNERSFCNLHQLFGHSARNCRGGGGVPMHRNSPLLI